MNSLLSKLLISLGIFFLPFLIFILIKLICHYRDYIKRMECVHFCETTFSKLKSLKRYLTAVEAEVGGGKTCLLSAISHYDTLLWIEEAKNYQEFVQVVLPDIDFKILNNLIDINYQLLNSAHAVYNELIKLEYVKENFKGIYSDHVSEFPKMTLLKKYVEARTSQLREHYIGSNFKLYNRISNNFNYEYSLEMLEIKDEEKQKDYLLPKYSSVFIDETLTSIYKNTNSNSIVGDTGLDTSERLIRHLGDEKFYLYSSAQNISRMSKLIRELGTCYILINSFEVTGIMKTLDSFLKRKEERLRDKIKDNEELMLQDNKTKRKLFKIYDKRKKLFASNYLKFAITFYSKEADIGRSVDKCEGRAEEYDLYFPLTWCWGVYDQTEFKFVDDFLNNVSNKSDIDLSIAKASLSELEKESKAKAILAKVEKESKENTKGNSQRTQYADLG